MNNDQFAGTTRSVGGHIEEAAGALTGDRNLQAAGIVNQVKGAAQDLYGDAQDIARDAYDRVAPVTREGLRRAVAVTREHSFLAILAAGAVGFAVAVALQSNASAGRDFRAT